MRKLTGRANLGIVIRRIPFIEKIGWEDDKSDPNVRLMIPKKCSAVKCVDEESQPTL
jgi:hypothetical protein